MRRFAFNKVFLYSGEGWTLPVVTVGEDGRYLSHFPLKGEERAVEWFGGVGVLLPEHVIPRQGDSVASLCHTSSSGVHPPLRLWQAVGLAADAPLQTPVSRWRPVV